MNKSAQWLYIAMVQTGILEQWFENRQWKVFRFQQEAWQAVAEGYSGLVNAPTGSGKTYALLAPMILLAREVGVKSRLTGIWITPIRALAPEIAESARRMAADIFPELQVAIRTGDTSSAERARQKREMPHILITTPESLHLFLASKGYAQICAQLKMIVADEWHELMGTKRGVQAELAFSRFKGIAAEQKRSLMLWGISATIGNIQEAIEVLHGVKDAASIKLVKSGIKKEVEIVTIMPEEIERFPWSGHLGIHLLEKVLPILRSSASTLIFTNTRSQAEIWYQRLLERAPELAGWIALHHGSLDKQVRQWVEDALHTGTLKAVVCTSSLDLGVDFRPVETVIQVGSPKGVARFLQRAGRSGHQPGALSRIYFLPTHSLEIVEGAALRKAAANEDLEQRLPYVRSFDVLIQYLVTLAISDGFYPEEIFDEILQTFSFQSISLDEWSWVLNFIVQGGQSLEAYDEFKRVEVEAGKLVVKDKRMALRHRLSIGTIVSDTALSVKMLSGSYLGTIEEYFISKLQPGDVFCFAGRNLELIRIKDMTVQVKISKKKNGVFPSWTGGRMPLSSNLAQSLRREMHLLSTGKADSEELLKLHPLIALQAQRSIVPDAETFLVEYFQSREGWHLMMYPYEGRFVHEGMSALLAFRIGQMLPITFSIAMNDYGFELLSDQWMDVREIITPALFSTERLEKDIRASVNAVEMANRKFRDIAHIAGLVFRGFPGKQKKDRHLQASSQLFFKVFQDYDPGNLLLQQAIEEAMTFQLEQQRLRDALQRIGTQKLHISMPEKPTPFAFPLMTDRLNREKLSTEQVEDRIRRMVVSFEK